MLKKIFSVENHNIHKVITIIGVKIKVKHPKLVLKRELNYYKSSLENIGKNSEGFVECAIDNINVQDPTKLIAFYLPQFHTFKENEEWHGKGFTEWTNVTKAKPIFTGHFQPQLPIDVGFYDLSSDKVMYRQIELAKQYGIHGFCFHYYWFSGKRLMEQPIFNWLKNKELDLPFCLCWANENWTKRWDGGENEVLMEQSLKEDDGKKFADDIIPFFEDDRYIKINDCPVLIIYRPGLFEQEIFLNFIKDLRAEILKKYKGLYLVMARTWDAPQKTPSDYNLDAAVEFPPHVMNGLTLLNNFDYIKPGFSGHIFNIEKYIKDKNFIYNVDYPLFKSVFPNWDNTARRATNPDIFEVTPELYKKWLMGCIKWTKENKPKEEQFVFINAWNEWAEGAHLEPDRKNGYAYLQATREALEAERFMEME